MKPLNYDDKGCNYVSSNCVVWQGPDIPCIKLCKGDSVSDVIHKLATELCDVLDTLDISTYDISCLGIACAPKNFHDFLQALINIICQLQDCCAANSGTGNRTVTEVTSTQIPVAPCFYYTNSFGDTVTTMTVAEYITAIGNRVCDIDRRLGIVQTTTAQNSNRIDSLQEQINNLPITTPELIIPVCVLPSVPSTQKDVLVALEAQYCELVAATGNATQIYAAILKQCTNLANETTLGGGGGTMGSLPGWDAGLLNLSSAINNIWLTVCDMRAAIKNIQLNCCPSGCDGVEISMTAIINGSDLVVFLTGTIPPSFVNCNPLGTLVTISDDLGGSFTAYIDVVTFINNPSGYTISMAATPINLGSNIHVNMEACVSNPSTGTTCKNCLEYLVVNVASCPSMTYTPNADSIDYTGVALPGTNDYEIQLWNSLGTIMVSSQTQTVTSPDPITGTFSSLTINTSYRIRVIVTTASGAVTTCPFEAVTLIPTPLTPIELNTATNFSVLGGGGITNSSGDGTSAFIGDVGSDPTNTVTGIAAPDVTGTLYTASDAAVIAAKTDLTNAIAEGLAKVPVTTLAADEIGTTTIEPGYYDTPGGTVTINGTVTLDGLGDVNSVFIIKTTTTLVAAAASVVSLTNGATWANVFWLVGSSATIGAGATFKGTILAATDITVAAAGDIQGRALANSGTVTLDTVNIYNV